MQVPWQQNAKKHLFSLPDRLVENNKKQNCKSPRKEKKTTQKKGASKKRCFAQIEVFFCEKREKQSHGFIEL